MGPEFENPLVIRAIFLLQLAWFQTETDTSWPFQKNHETSLSALYSVPDSLSTS